MTVHFLSFLKQTLQSERPKATHPFPGRLRTLDLLPRIARNGYSALLLVGLLECKAWKPRHLEVEPKVNDLEISYVYVIGGSILWLCGSQFVGSENLCETHGLFLIISWIFSCFICWDGLGSAHYTSPGVFWALCRSVSFWPCCPFAIMPLFFWRQLKSYDMTIPSQDFSRNHGSSLKKWMRTDIGQKNVSKSLSRIDTINKR